MKYRARQILISHTQCGLNAVCLPQGWALTQSHTIKSHPLCLAVDSSKLSLTTCQGTSKEFFHRHDNGIIQHGPTNTCLAVIGVELQLNPCDLSDPTLYWDYLVPGDLHYVIMMS